MIAPWDLVALALHRRADPGAVTRGVDVERQGKVVHISIAADGRTLEGQVRGSGGKTYRQVVTIRHGHGPQGLDLRGHCSCPVGQDCKHVVALCLLAAEKIVARGEPQQPVPPTPAIADHQIAHWLRRVEAAERAQVGNSEGYSPSVRDRLIYVISQSGTGPLQMEPWKGRLNKDGGIGGRPRRYDPANVDRGNRAQFVQLSDEKICRELVRLRQNYGTGDIGATLLKQAVATGRARLDEATGLALENGDPRDGQFLWEETEAGAQHLVARDDAGQRLHTLALTPPWYVDPQTGEAAPFETGLSPAMAAAMAMAPVIPAEAALGVAEAFALRREAALPAPKSIGVRHEQGVTPVPVLTLRASDVRGDIRATSRQGYGWGPSIDLTLPVLDLGFTYGDAEPVASLATSDSSPPPIRLTDDEGVILIGRDPDQEAQLLQQLASRVGAHGLIAAPRARHSAELANAPGHAFLSMPCRKRVVPGASISLRNRRWTRLLSGSLASSSRRSARRVGRLRSAKAGIGNSTMARSTGLRRRKDPALTGSRSR